MAAPARFDAAPLGYRTAVKVSGVASEPLNAGPPRAAVSPEALARKGLDREAVAHRLALPVRLESLDGPRR